MIPVFDGHNDALLRLSMAKADPVAMFRDGAARAMWTCPRRARAAWWAASSPTLNQSLDFKIFDDPPYDIPLPDPMPKHAAEMPVSRQVDIASALEAEGLIRMVRTRADIVPDADGPLTVVLHLEGAECIDADLDGSRQALRCGAAVAGAGLVAVQRLCPWRAVPHGSDGDTGPGLTEAGRALVRECSARDGRRLQPHHREGFLGHRERRARRWWPPIPTPARSR
jgi:membrane dipeptidase